MYELLLEKEARLFFGLVQTLAQKNGQSLAQLTEDLAASAHQILLSIHRWRVKGQHLQVGVDVVKDNGRLYVLKSENFDHRTLFAQLLQNSIAVDLLWLLWHNPSFGIGELAQATFHSPQTIRRRLRGVLPLLSQYDLQLTLQKRPVIQGAEAQLRFFYLHLTFLQEGIWGGEEPNHALDQVSRLGAERRKQGSLIEGDWFDHQWIEATLGLGEYVVNERGFRFLWHQLAGLEPVWISGQLDQALRRFFDYESIFLPYKRELSGALYRILLMALLFKGDLSLALTKEKAPINVSVNRLERLFQEYLPQYDELKALHPELGTCYGMILQEFRQMLSPLKRAGSC